MNDTETASWKMILFVTDIYISDKKKSHVKMMIAAK